MHSNEVGDFFIIASLFKTFYIKFLQTDRIFVNFEKYTIVNHINSR